MLQRLCAVEELCKASAIAAYDGREAPIVARARLLMLQDAGMSKAVVALASTMGGDAAVCAHRRLTLTSHIHVNATPRARSVRPCVRPPVRVAVLTSI